MNLLLKLALLAAASGAMVGTYAATATQTFGVKLVVQESCSIGTTPTDVDFGTHTRQTTAVNTDAAGSLSINCSSGTPYTIALNGGLNATASTRQMLSGANVAAYVLYQDSARATPWGNGTTFGTTVSGTGTGAAVATPVYGRLTSLNFPAGTYSDTVTATVTY
ncbi:spore coat protein U domain-containing protein [Ramlibacter sp. G-1-2-2]|uniref:Spore coat protein U domain-containing protein n=1 Tax=Ramlibacter agri TaxID=2728837 RepID=A0A848H018_9BURK|nr:spore coat U domain-containing protein [Ramlibacter agri]NML42962.1 spore coat protein U domain-containing protein [Ramlibacter agri]